MNKRVKCINGNRENSFNLVHWNLGARYWDKKVDDIQAMVDELKPDLALISEANLFTGLEVHLRLVTGYSVHCTKGFEVMGYSRLVLLVRDGFEVEVIENWMEDDLATIWLKIRRRGGKCITIGGIYREHRLLLQGYPNTTGDDNCQNTRWSRIIKQWINASKDGQCIIIGDLNLDQLTWGDPEWRHQQMVQQMKEEIETLNFSQLIEGATRCWPGADDSLIDHCWVNCGDRIISVKNSVRAVGDHNLLEVQRSESKEVLTLSRTWSKETGS